MNGSSRIIRSIMLFALVALVVGALGAKAWAWPWEKRARQADLKEILKNPAAFVGRQITIKCRFAMRGKLFKDFNTRFNAGEHANFAVWKVDARLWEKAERRGVLPTLYLDKGATANFRMLNRLKRYDIIEVRGRVVSAYAGLPWIYVSSLRKLPNKEEIVNDIALVHVRRGLQLLQEGKAAVAAKQLEMALDAGVAKSHKAFIFMKLAQAYKESDGLSQARDALDKAIKLDDQNVKAYYDLAQVQLGLRNADGVVENCKKIFAISADYPQAHGLLAEAYGMMGQTGEALQECDIAAEVPGLSAYDKAMVEVRRARVLVQASRYADAIRAYAQAIGEGPLGGEAWLRMEIGKLYESRYDATGNTKNLTEAVREYANANVLANNADKEGLYLAARAAFKVAKSEQAGTYTKAKDLLASCLAIAPDYTPAQVLGGKIALTEGDAAGAKKCIDALMANAAENLDALLQMGGLYEKMNMQKEAMSLYARIIEAVPGNAVVLEKHVNLCTKAGDADGAKASLAALVDLYPDNPDYSLQLGSIYFESGAYATAAQILAVAAKAEGPQAEEAGMLLGRARALAGDDRGAEAALRRVVKKYPNNTEAMGRLAMLLADRGGRGGEALGLAEKAYAANPGDAMYADILGWAQVAAGKPADAVATLDKIPAAQRGRMVWYHTAFAKFKAGDFAGATDAANMALIPAQPGEVDIVVKVIAAKAKALLEDIGKAQKKALQESLRRQREELEKQIKAEAGRKKTDQQIEEERIALEKEAKQIRDELEKINVNKDALKDGKVEAEPDSPVKNEKRPEVLRTKAQADSGREKAGTKPVARIPEVKLAPKPVEKKSVAVKKETVVEIPGVVEPDFENDISTMNGPAKRQNTVSNLPAAVAVEKVERKTEKPENATAEFVPEPAAEKAAKNSVAAPTGGKAEASPAPTISIGWEKAKKSAGRIESKAEAKKSIPRNDINSLPDWAK